MAYNIAAAIHSAGLADYEKLIGTACFIRDFFPPMHAEGPRFVDHAALDSFASVSTEELLPSLKFLDDHLVMNDQRST